MNTKIQKLIHDTATGYAEEFPGEALCPNWSATAWQVDGDNLGGMSWREYHDAIEAELAKLARRAVTYRLFWTSTDGQASLPMGDFATEQEAWDAVPEAAAKLVAQGGTAEGCWTVEEKEAR